MTSAERLLNLSAEYAAAREVEADYPNAQGVPAHRPASVIADEYGATLREFLAGS
jgi:hypothetical protein